MINNNDNINRRGYAHKTLTFWIGLSDVKHEGDWRLASNHSKKPSYLNWHTDEPTNGTNKNCARLRTRRTGPSNSRKDTWADAKCRATTFDHGDETIYFHALCEFDSLATSSTDDTSTKGASTKLRFDKYFAAILNDMRIQGLRLKLWSLFQFLVAFFFSS